MQQRTHSPQTLRRSYPPHATGILILVCCLLALAFPCKAEEITLVADEWCPYNCIPGSERPGFMVEIARAVFEEAGITVRYKTMPWSRAIEETRNGRFHGVIGATHSEAPDFVFPHTAQAMSTIVFIAKTDAAWRYTDITSLGDIRLGVIQDYSYGETMDEYIKANKGNESRIHLTTGDQAFNRNITMLELDRVNAILMDRAVYAQYNFFKGKQGDFSIAGELNTDPVYIAFTPSHPVAQRYAAQLTQGVKQLRTSGRLTNILARYGLTDWATP